MKALELQQSKYLHRTLIIAFFVVSAYLLIGILQGVHDAGTAYLFIGVLAALVVFIALVRRGYAKSASRVFLCFLWLALTFQSVRAEGVQDMAIAGLTIVIIAAGLLLGGRAIFVFMILSTGSAWLTAILQESGRIPYKPPQFLGTAVDVTMIFVIVAATAYLLSKAQRDAVLRYHQESVDRHKAEEEIRVMNADLELRVERRTEELRHKAEELEDAHRELASISYAISHDLRSPIRAVDSYARIVMEESGGGNSGEVKDHIARIRSAARRMNRLLDDLLAFLHLSRHPISPAPVSMKDEAERICEMRSARLSESGIAIRVEDMPTCVGDASLLAIVWDNLLDNAIKFTADRPVREVILGGVSEEGQNVFFVRDTGSGFDMAYAKKLFGMFQRLHDFHEYPGSGIGLAIVHRIVERHGGTVWAESRPSVGTTIRFSLPKPVTSPPNGRN